MLEKKTLLHGIVAGLLAAIAAFVYFKIYQEALGTSFDKVVSSKAILAASVFGCLLMSLGFVLVEKVGKGRFTGAYYLCLAVLSFLSILGPLSISLPIDTARPELFPGLTVPMHFFPLIAFLSIAPFFRFRADISLKH